MASYISRPLARALKNTRSKVLILEGARAVGKTMLVQRELPSFRYESLADESTYRYAKSHLHDWLSSLPAGTIIDEAQRIPGLPLAIKRIVDATTDTATQFILTGSASITRNGLDGQDPLTRRSRRFLLSPLTRHEYYGNATISIVDKLWSYDLNQDYGSETSLSDIRRYMEIGGFPSYIADNAFITPEVRQFSVRDDIDNVLGDTILPGEHLDKSIAQSVLQELLATPGGILNLKRIADLVHVDARTVERYVSIFASRFLIRTLPNLKTTANRQVLARSKVHPLDTSFSTVAFAHSGKDINQDRALFGQVFESYVVNQIVPEAQWASNRPDVFYWRESGTRPREVDLVLVRDNELIGIEVKSNSRVDRTDFAGLAQLKSKETRFRRGYVVYCGSRIKQFADDMWAIPVSALWDGNAFIDAPNTHDRTDNALFNITQPEIPHTVQGGSLSDSEYDANIFLSYRHQDNDYLDNAILDFTKNVSQAYEYQTGRKLHLFTDQEISWGSDWQKILDANITKANILFVAVTPMYLKSEACRKELLEFDTRTGQHSGNKILPMVWQNLKAIPDSDTDPVRNIIQSRQFISVEDLAYESTDTRLYKRRISEIAMKLQETIQEQNEEMDKAVNQEAHDVENSVDDSNAPDYLSMLAKAEESSTSMQTDIEDFSQSFDNIINRLNSNHFPRNASAAKMLLWGKKLSAESEEDVNKLNKSIKRISDTWDNYYLALQLYVDQIANMPMGASRNQQIDTVMTTLDQLSKQFIISDEMQYQIDMLRAFGNLIRPLQPITTSITDAIAFFSSIQTQAKSLQRRLSALSR